MQATPLGGYSRMLRDVPELRLVNLVVPAGQVVSSHLAPVDVVFFALDGCGSLVVEDTTVSIAKGAYLVCPAHARRSILADQGCDLELLVIRCPNL